MATSKTEICNLALSRCQADRISDIDETGSENARVCRLHYNEALKELLRMGAWSFATKRAQLSRDTTAPAFGWSYRYPVPIDLVHVLEANDLDAELYYPEDFALENGYILSDSQTCKIRYVYFNEDPSMYPSDFVAALTLLLGSMVAIPITGNYQLAAALKAEFEAIEMPRAMRQGGNENRNKRRYKPFESDLVKARYTRNS